MKTFGVSHGDTQAMAQPSRPNIGAALGEPTERNRLLKRLCALLGDGVVGKALLCKYEGLSLDLKAKYVPGSGGMRSTGILRSTGHGERGEHGEHEGHKENACNHSTAEAEIEGSLGSLAWQASLIDKSLSHKKNREIDHKEQH